MQPAAVAWLGAVVLLVGAISTTGAAAEDEPRLLSWEELLPPGENERLEALYREYLEAQAGGSSAALSVPEGGAGDFMPQLGTFSTVAGLDDVLIKLPGFVVPLDFSQGSYAEFLLVPYFGACIHTPPPPPNQLIYVRAAPAVEVDSIWEPVWVVGRLHTQRQDTGTGNAAYTLDLLRLEAYDVGR